jgi:phage repressor protein C with HTH and peptisase S24 domain
MEIHIGLALKQVIEGKGLNKAALARKLNITPQGLNSMFKRESMETRTLTKIADLIEVPIQYFFGEKWESASVNPSVDGNRSAINQRFIKAMEAVIAQRMVGDTTDFFKAIGAPGAPEQYVSGLRRNERLVTSEMGLQLNRMFGIRLKWLHSGEGNMFESNEYNSAFETSNQTGDHSVLEEPALYKVARQWSLAAIPFVPLSARSSFAEAFLAGNYDNLATRLYHLDQPAAFQREQAFSFEVEGGSMEPTLERGDTVIATPINQNNWEYATGGIYVLMVRDLVVIKRIISNDLMPSQSLLLHSDNPNGGVLRIKHEDIRAMFKVCLIYRVIRL